VPRNRSAVERGVKVDEVVTAAEELFLENGYAATTMSAIASRAGVANNAVYWYFPSKDDVFVAVLDRRLSHALDRISTRRHRTVEAQARAALRELDTVSSLTAAVHERAREAPVVAEFHARFHTTVQHLLAEALGGIVQDGEAEKAAALIMAVIEGLHLHSGERGHRRDELVVYLLGQLAKPC
jgi:TetR/AcrR family transcriptional regulator of autoinduction and epiphytic fitness